MKKITSLVLTLVLAVPYTLIPSVALADQPTASIDSVVTSGNPCLGTDLTVTGSGTVTPANGSQIDQYHVQVVWNTGDIETNIPLDLGGDTTSPYSFTFSAGPHHYSSTPTTTVSVMVYHSKPNGKDNQIDATQIVPTCPPNTAPAATGSSVTTPEDTAKVVTMTATDSDTPAQPLTYFIVNGPTHGTLGSVSGNQVTYTPSLNYNGGDAFSFKVSDGLGYSNVATTTITVTPENDAPVASSTAISINEDTDVSSNLAASDIDGDSLTYATTSNPANGTITSFNSTTGAFTYTPNADFNGSDSFNFKVYDGTVDSNTATVSITVNSVNDNPVLSISTTTSVALDELTNLSFTASATDVDSGDVMTYSLSGEPTGAGIDSSTGVFTWTPAENQGPATYNFNVLVSDGNGGTDTKAVTVVVNEVNVAPVAQSLTVSTHQNTAVNDTVVATDSDLVPLLPNTLTFSILTQPIVVGASVIMNPDGSFTYTPATDYQGLDSFTYEVSDGTLTSSATVTINVNDNAPILNVISDYVVNELSNLNFTISANDLDSPLDTLVYSLVGSVPSGVTLDSVTGIFDWTPAEDQGPGVYNFTASVTDGALQDSKTFKVTVNEVNEAPVANDLSVSTDEDTATSTAMTATDVDLPAQTLTFATTSNPTKGTLTSFDLNTGAFTYTPNANENGSDSFTFVANDGVTNSSTATVSIDIKPVNDLPSITLFGNNPINLLVGDTFVDPGASSTDPEDGDITSSIVVTGTVSTSTPGTYTLTYTAMDSEDASTSTTRTVIVTAQPVENTQPLCTDGIDNDGDRLVDLADPDCAAFIPAPTPVTPPSGGGGGNGPIVGSLGGGGQVLGASTTAGEVLGESCGLYLNTHFRLGSSKNNASQVKKLQEFLNKNMGTSLPITGFYGPMTYGVVKNFQTKYSDDVLKPWGLTSATGLVYLSTVTKINNLECPELMAQLPELIPWSMNPNAQ
ncbi:MAG: putative RTX toxin [Parcubacteria bacterium C7867-006]|nr:MAG: putative RTX toxin [Parcubacteria bacterium C7867-006]